MTKPLLGLCVWGAARVLALGLVLTGLPAWAATAMPTCEQVRGQGEADAGVQQVLPGIAVVHGRWPAVGPGTRPAHIATSVLLGQGSVTVVDPGPSHAAGRALQHKLACHPARVVGVVNTHAHAEQVLANSAFQAPVMALQGTTQAMQKRCPDCLAAMREDLGTRALQGTRIVWPQQRLQDGQSLPAGGRVWQVREMRQAHTETDLVLWSRGAGASPGVVLAGGLVDGRWPVLAQGRVLGWLQALDQLQAMRADWLIGQHVVAGPAQVLPVLQRQRDYLCGLLEHAWRRLELGQSEAEGVQGLVVPAHWPAPTAQEAEAWRQQHLFNQLRAWREAEQWWLVRQPWPEQCGSAPDVGR